MSRLTDRLQSQSAVKTFYQYFIPTLFGMMLMSVNIVADGIFVGHGVGSVALASVNVAVPVYSIIISISLLIGVGGGTLYSNAMGEGNTQKAQRIFTISIVFITIIIILISTISYLFMEPLALFFGANEETLPYTMDYMRILLMFGLVVALENCMSVFVRNDGDPQLAMVGLIVTALLNIALNYWMVFILDWEVTGSALATVIATLAGLLVYLTHFLKKDCGLKFIKEKWSWRDIKQISLIGLPSFLSEAGTGLFVMGYNIAIAYYAGTNGLAAFSVINYLHTFMFLAFIGIGQSIQPMISFYYGSKDGDKIKETVKVAEWSGLILGVIFIGIGYFGAEFLVSIFGITSPDIVTLTAKGIRLFFIGYLFMGTNFIYMTYFQSIGYVGPSIGITVFRGFILLLAALYALPLWFGISGVWLALPVAEGIVAITLLIFSRRNVMEKSRSY
ncbi:MATE family efflux transporter [Virgibacillus phasianinus]|uniref:Multidrug export protein MepA n=1 Tax=Virgibacillus phasianinus TaxID=2017483 RepID=A0A220U6Z9_9BACI|nr:MATE family efflux transporter [Virgibacillus phasianinus]ASK63897.1 MATE family efflux transporter [Virgibacillus phasianinus]